MPTGQVDLLRSAHSLLDRFMLEDDGRPDDAVDRCPKADEVLPAAAVSIPEVSLDEKFDAGT